MDRSPKLANHGSFRGERFACASPAQAVDLCSEVARGARDGAEEPCALLDATGRVVAVDVVLPRDSPPFDHSAMDGYAIVLHEALSTSSGDWVPLEVAGESRIGRAPPRLHRPGLAIRISTGAPIPQGADCVVRREDVREVVAADGCVTAIAIETQSLSRSRVGDHIRRRGENGPLGTLVVPRGTILGPGQLGSLAACGMGTISVRPRIVAQILTTGDELADPSTPVGPFGIFNSNAFALHGLLSAHHWMSTDAPAHLADAPSLVAERLRELARTHDAVLITGGVSMGHRDPVRSAVDSIGARILFHGLPQRPGKPMLVAVEESRRHRPFLIFGLPGNPASALVTARRIALPVLAVLAGATFREHGLRVSLANDDGRRLPVWWHRLVSINGDGVANLVDHRGSGDLVALGKADGFVELPPEDQPAASASDGTALYFPFRPAH